MILNGIYFDGKSARGIPVQLTVAQDTLHVQSETLTLTEAITNIELTPRLARTRRQLRFADGAVCEVDDDRELLAVIAHELGHEHERHAMQQMLASSGVSALIFVITGDVSGLANIAILAPTVLTHMHHSRALERDADRFAFALLQRNAIEPIWFARIIRKLEASHHSDEDADTKSRYSSWLSTHPDSEARAADAEHYLEKQK